MRTLILLWTTLLLTSCSGDDYFWIKSKTFPLVQNEEGELIDIKTIRHVGQYNNFADTSQSYQGPIKGSIVNVWKVTRLKGGKTDLSEVCGKTMKFTGYYDKTPRERDLGKNVR